jgi:hypothetical protein
MSFDTSPWRITVYGTRGGEWVISGPDPMEVGEGGIKLASDPKGFYDAPFKTLRNSTAYQEGATYGGAKYEARDETWKIKVYSRPSRSKMSIESEWRRNWSPDKPCRVVIEDTEEGTTRELLLQLESAPELVTPLQGRDLNLAPTLDVVMSTVSYWPFATSADQHVELETSTFVPDPSPNRIPDPGFSDLINLWWNFGSWVKDTGVGHTANGSARVNANGTRRILRSTSIAARSSQLWPELSCWVQWGTLTAGGGAAITLEVEAFNGGTSLGVTTVGNIMSPGTGGTWAQLKKTDYTTPVGTTVIKLQLAVEASVSAGQVWADDFVAASVTTYTATMNGTLWNPTDRKLYPFWTLSATVPTIWTVPDYSFGDDYWDLAVEHAERMVPLRQVNPGQDLTIDVYPRNERIGADDESLQWARQNGIDFLYAVPPYTPPTPFTVKATVVNTSEPVGALLKMRRNWSRPWGLIDPDIPLELAP